MFMIIIVPIQNNLYAVHFNKTTIMLSQGLGKNIQVVNTKILE